MADLGWKLRDWRAQSPYREAALYCEREQSVKGSVKKKNVLFTFINSFFLYKPMSRCKCGTVSDKSICCDVNVASLTLKYSQCTVWCTVFSPRSSLSPPTHPVMILSFISGDAKAKLRDESAADISLISKAYL